MPSTIFNEKASQCFATTRSEEDHALVYAVENRFPELRHTLVAPTSSLGFGGFDFLHETERHLLYVACTRARDRLLVSGVAPGSEFLDDLGAI